MSSTDTTFGRDELEILSSALAYYVREISTEYSDAVATDAGHQDALETELCDSEALWVKVRTLCRRTGN